MARRRTGKKQPPTVHKAIGTSRPRGRIDRLFGLLANKGLLASKRPRPASIEEINEAIERGWAGEK
jgi:hypothetical protein